MSVPLDSVCFMAKTKLQIQEPLLKLPTHLGCKLSELGIVVALLCTAGDPSGSLINEQVCLVFSVTISTKSIL